MRNKRVYIGDMILGKELKFPAKSDEAMPAEDDISPIDASAFEEKNFLENTDSLEASDAAGDSCRYENTSCPEAEKGREDTAAICDSDSGINNDEDLQTVIIDDSFKFLQNLYAVSEEEIHWREPEAQEDIYEYSDLRQNIQEKPFNEAEKKKRKVKTKKGLFTRLFSLRALLNICLLIVFCTSILMLVFVRFVSTDSVSMENTIMRGELVLAVKYPDYNPAVGDAAVIETNTTDGVLIRRVIAVSGQTVKIDEKSSAVIVDNVIIDEPYLKSDNSTKAFDIEFPVTVPEGYVFVLGDNRENSVDSRSSDMGLVSIDKISAKAEMIVFPMNRFGSIN